MLLAFAIARRKEFIRIQLYYEGPRAPVVKPGRVTLSRVRAAPLSPVVGQSDFAQRLESATVTVTPSTVTVTAHGGGTLSWPPGSRAIVPAGGGFPAFNG